MMSVPAINSVLPPSGNQPAKINSSPTASSSVSSLGITVPPKISVIPPPQISTSPNKAPPIGVNYSQVPLSLVYENKVGSSQGQSGLVNKQTGDKPKDLSPSKPTSNGVETTTVNSPNTHTSQSTSPSSKIEDVSVQKSTVNHSEEKNLTKSEVTPAEEKITSTSTSQIQNSTVEKVETKERENILKEDKKLEEDAKEVKEKKESNENLKTESNEEKEEKKPATVATPTTSPPAPDPAPAPASAPASAPAPASASTSAPAPAPANAATVSGQTNKRKREQKPEEDKKEEPEPEKKTRRIRSQVLPYQSPLPELATFINKSLKEKDASQKNNEEKLIVFYKNEFLAVRNAEGGFYLCQTLQNVYRTSHRIRIRWLSQKKEGSGDEGDIYTPDFYDLTDFECILTTVALSKMEKSMYKLRKVELERIENILKRALDVEKGVTEKPSITEEHPDGIDLSLYKDESQLQKPKKATKRKATSPESKSPKQTRRSGSEPATRSQTAAKVAVVKSSKKGKKVKKTPAKRGKGKQKGKSESSKTKIMDQLKVSPPNEKARVVAKVLRKVDIVPVKEVTTKKAKSKAIKRSTGKSQKKKGQKTAKKSSQETGKDDQASPHHERRQGKNKYSNNKNKKN